MTTAITTDAVASGDAASTAHPDLGAFYAERTRQHGEYVAACIELVDRATRALQARLGADARLAVQSLKPSEGQRQIAQNGVLQANGVAVFGFTIDFQSPQIQPHVVSFFLSVGKLAGAKGKPDDWYVGHDDENVSMPRGGEDQELAPLVAHVIAALEAEIVKAYPTGATQEKVRSEAPAKNAENGREAREPSDPRA
ncbi:MAG TPA: hypothetical protein VHS09_02375 [Polyangiaceae bacterium]|jgi:hypothetical protein|nr:hypothetical protein [Polyangiaceae bacterium]